MTSVTAQEFASLPEYSCSVPTFHPVWLEPGRYWKSSNQFFRKPNEPIGEWRIHCYVANSAVDDEGMFDLGIMTDDLLVQP